METDKLWDVPYSPDYRQNGFCQADTKSRVHITAPVINRRPRKILNFESPKKVFFKQIANFAVAS